MATLYADTIRSDYITVRFNTTLTEDNYSKFTFELYDNSSNLLDTKTIYPNTTSPNNDVYCTFQSLIPNKEYGILATSTDPDGTVGEQDYVTCTTYIPSPTLSVTSITQSSVSLKATLHSSGGVESNYSKFSFWLGDSNGNLINIVDVSPNTSSPDYEVYYTWNDLNYSTTYTFTVTADHPTNYMDSDNDQNSTTATTSSPSLPRLSTPSNLTASTPIVVGEYTTLTWDGVSNAESYEIAATYDDTGSWVDPISVSSTSYDYQISPYITDYSTVQFRVRAEGSGYTDSYWTYSPTYDLSYRPSEFEWDTEKTLGGSPNITATEWNRLIDNIDEVRNYKGLSAYSINNRVTQGDGLTASLFNSVVSSINELNPPTSPPTSKISIYDVDDLNALPNNVYVEASDLNLLRDSINSVV